MEHRLTIVETEIIHLKKITTEMHDLVGKHEIACEIHAPKAESAHNGVISMSKEIAIISQALLSVTNTLDGIHGRNTTADKSNADFQKEVLEELAELRGEKRVASWVSRGLISAVFVGFLWVANELQTLHHNDDVHDHPTAKAIKRDKSIDKDEEE